MFRSTTVRWATVILILIAISPSLVFAQPTQIVPCTGVDCRFCDIGQLAQNVLNTGVYLAVFLSAILFAYAGWNYVTAGGDPGKAGEAKKFFWNVGIGLVLILCAWLIVDLIMKTLVSEGALFGPWNEVC